MRYPYPEVLNEIPIEGHAVIEASAGTGKTYTIEHLVVDRLLKTTARIDQLLVVTFTDKATSELRKRIRDLIERVLTEAEAHDRAVERGEAPATGEGEVEQAWEIDAEARRRLERALFSFDKSAILTIHAFCRKVLVDLAFDSGQLFEQELVDGRRSFQAAWRASLREQLSTQPELRKAVEKWLNYNNGDLGNLEELLYRAHCAGYLELQRPFQLEVNQVAERLLTEWDLSALREDLEGCAIVKDALAQALQLLEQINLILSEQISTQEKATYLMKLDLQAIIKPRRSSSKLKRRFPEELSERSQRFLFALNQLSLLFEMESAVERHVVDALLPQVSATLTQRKRGAGELDYDDLLRSVWRALQSPQGPSLAGALRDRFRYALIDEFQDTDPLQWKIFKRVFVDGRSTAHGLYIIGDPKQAIYTFRGADVHTYIRARLELTQASAPRVLLKRNYRSSPRLVEAVNELLKQEGKAPIFQGPIQYAEPVECGRDDLRLCDHQGYELPPVTLWRHKPPPPSKGQARIALGPLKRLYAQKVAHHIQEVLHDPERGLWIEEGARGEAGHQRRRIEANDILILVRENREALEIADALRAAEIPFTLYKPEGLLQGHEAGEIYTLLKAIVDPHHRGARLNAFTTPFFGVPWHEVYHYHALPPGHHRLERLLAWHQLAAQGRYGALFYELLHHSGLSERELFFAESERELTNYQHIFEILLGVTAQHQCTPRELLTLLGRYIKGLESPPGSEDNIHRLYSDRQMVQVMTIHKSKGLEAPVIYLFGGFGSPPEQAVNIIHDEQLGRRVLVGSTARKVVAQRLKEEQYQEDQRLLYVALTRPQVKLYLPFVDSSRALSGTYQPLKERLRAMDEEGLLGGERFELEELEGLEQRRYVTTSHKSVADWAPPLELFEVPSIQESLKVVLSEQRPLLVTSYTGLKQSAGLHSLLEPVYSREGLEALGEGSPQEDVTLEGASEDVTVAFSGPQAPLIEELETIDDELPGGKEMGQCLHEIIEEVSIKSLKRPKHPAEWAERAEVNLVFMEVMRRHNVDQRWVKRLQELVFYTLKSKVISVEPQLKLPALSSLKHLIEMEFMYPIPEHAHPSLSERVSFERGLTRPHWQVERGYVKGFIDFVCEHKGKYYVIDWKSDLLASYQTDAVTRHVQAHYLLQAQLYTLGVARWLKITSEESYDARFGGVLYLFMRAFREHRDPTSGEGVYYRRPPWAEVQRYEGLLSQAVGFEGQR